MSDISLFLWALRVQRNYRALCALIFVLGMSTGCIIARWPDTPRRHVDAWERTLLIDDRFTAGERALIIRGFDAWPAAVGDRNIVLRYRVMPHDAAELAASTPSMIHVVRRTEEEGLLPCENAVGCWDPNTTRILITPSALRKDALTAVASHELGHAAGLHDLFDVSAGLRIMAGHTGLMPDRPTAADAEAFCKIHGCE